SKIAKEAGVGMGTIYNYFKSKEELVNALYLQIKKNEADYMMEGCKTDLPVRRKFAFFWRRIFQYNITHPMEFRFLEYLHFCPMIAEESKRQGAAYFAQLAAVYEEGQAHDIMKKGDITKQIYFTNGALGALAKYHILGCEPLTEEEIDEAVTAAWDALKK
ncbi:MAG: TetR/AcrR family transcriptional regulator, partial [bacterium]|nr:TetR/AcrR family transcriptional regulator [bacterium]